MYVCMHVSILIGTLMKSLHFSTGVVLYSHVSAKPVGLMSPETTAAKEIEVYKLLSLRIGQLCRLKVSHELKQATSGGDGNCEGTWDVTKEWLLEQETMTTDAVLEALQLPATPNAVVNFYLDRLKNMSETAVQSHITGNNLNIAANGLLDTHQTNASAKSVCFSDPKNVNAQPLYCPSAKPDFTNQFGPFNVEIKSDKSKKASSMEQQFDDVCDAKSDIVGKKASSMEQKFGDLGFKESSRLTQNLCDVKSDGVGKNANSVEQLDTSSMEQKWDGLEIKKTSNLTQNVCDVLQQAIERVIQVATFRAYISRYIVVASTGFWTLCLFLTQDFSQMDEKERRVLKIFRITNDSANHIWSAFVNEVKEKGPMYYLTSHAPLIMNALTQVKEISHRQGYFRLLRYRVHVAAVSGAVVYYITPPDAYGNVRADEKMFAFKVVLDNERFAHEVKCLNAIAEKWSLRTEFYYLASYKHQDRVVTMRPRVNLDRMVVCDDRVTNEVDLWWQYNNEFNKFPAGDGGVIIMRAALREFNDKSPHNKFCQLCDSLCVAHAARILHCDLRPHNCLYFEDENGGHWQVVDYDRAVHFENYENGATTTMVVGSNQFVSCGNTVLQQAIGYEKGDQIEVIVSPIDDIKMLQKTCM